MMPDESASYEDDTSISNEAELWRRIPPRHLVPDKNRGGMRISKAAFDNHPNGTPMSVVLGDEILAAGREPSSVIDGHEGFYLASLTAGLARSLGQGVVRNPTPDEPAHAEVFGKKTDSTRKKLAKAATWVIGPRTSDV